MCIVQSSADVRTAPRSLPAARNMAIAFMGAGEDTSLMMGSSRVVVTQRHSSSRITTANPIEIEANLVKSVDVDCQEQTGDLNAVANAQNSIELYADNNEGTAAELRSPRTTQSSSKMNRRCSIQSKLANAKKFALAKGRSVRCESDLRAPAGTHPPSGRRSPGKLNPRRRKQGSPLSPPAEEVFDLLHH